MITSTVLALLAAQPAPLPPLAVGVYPGIPYIVPSSAGGRITLETHTVTGRIEKDNLRLVAISRFRNLDPKPVKATIAVPMTVQSEDNGLLTWSTINATWGDASLSLSYPGLPDIPISKPGPVNLYQTAATGAVSMTANQTVTCRMVISVPLGSVSNDPLRYIVYSTSTASRSIRPLNQFRFSVQFQPGQVFAIDSHFPDTTQFQLGAKGVFFRSDPFAGSVPFLSVAFYPEPSRL